MNRLDLIRTLQEYKNRVVKGGPGSGCRGDNCGRPTGIRPAIEYKDQNGKYRTIAGKLGQIHADVYLDHEDEIGDAEVHTGFVDDKDEWLDRNQLAERYGVASSEALAELQEVSNKFIKALRESTIKKGGPGSGCHGPNCGRPSTGVKETSTSRIKQNPITPLPEGRKWIDHAPGTPNNTLKANLDELGNLKPERQKLHDEIASKFLDHVKAVPEDKQPVAVVMMDGPGSGKSTFVDAIDNGDFVRVDADAIKQNLPEFQQSLKAGAKDAAVISHDESSMLASRIKDGAVGSRKNLIFDGTGKNAEKYITMISDMKQRGYKVTVIMPSIPLDTALERVRIRAERTGRLVPESLVREAYSQIETNFDKISKIADSAQLYDNIGKEPRLIFESDDKGERIHDKEFFSRFRQKA